MMTMISVAEDVNKFRKLPYGRVLMPVDLLEEMGEKFTREHQERIRAEDEAFLEAEAKAKAAKEAEDKMNKDLPSDEDAVKASPTQAKKTRKVAASRLVQAFNRQQLDREHERWKKGTGEKKGLKFPFLEAAKVNDGRREVPVFGKKLKPKLESLRENFPNFVPAIDHLERELLLMSLMPASDFHISPILLDGVPGIGKTAFSMRLAEALGLEIDKTNASGLQSGAAILGGSSFYHSTEPSPLFYRLAKGRYATFVLLLDELDKVGGDERFPIVPALLSLLEPETARQIKCENTGIEHDLSKVIVIATSNEKDLVPAPLRSRLTVFDILPPTIEQRKMIALKMHAAMKKKARRAIELDHEALDQMARSDCDLREMTRAIRRGFGDAVVDGVRASRPVVLSPSKKRSPGFV